MKQCANFDRAPTYSTEVMYSQEVKFAVLCTLEVAKFKTS